MSLLNTSISLQQFSQTFFKDHRQYKTDEKYRQSLFCFKNSILKWQNVAIRGCQAIFSSQCAVLAHTMYETLQIGVCVVYYFRQDLTAIQKTPWLFIVF